MIFSKDKGGNEDYQLYTFNVEDLFYIPFTPENARSGSCVWSDCGNFIVYYSTARNGKDTDIYFKNIKDNKDPILLLEVKGSWSPLDFVGERVLLKEFISAQESYIYILNLKTGELDKIPSLGSNEPRFAYGTAKFSKLSTAVFFTSNEANEFKKLYSFSNYGFKALTQDIDWSVSQFVVAHDDSIFYVTNEDGISVLYHQTALTREKLNIPLGFIWNLHLRGTKLGFTLSTPQMSADVFVYHAEYKLLERWTYSETGELKSENFVIPSLIHYNSFDSLKIPSFYYKPTNVDPNKKLPVMIYIHGGPESQILPILMKNIQFFVIEFGMAVLTPNVRGSTGYGKTYMNMDNVYKREDSVKDIGALLEWISQQKELDPKRIIVKGGSYGGYMTLATMIHYGSKISAGISTVGISNFITFLKNTKSYRVDLRRVEYGDERDPKVNEFLHKISPLTNAHKIDKPLFIIQGGNDPRVPLTEAEQMMKEVKKNGTPVWYLMAKNEGHGFRKRVNVEMQYLCEAMFVQKYLK
jgi:dipeptidyl aminopeptidase/acylaminoacyl peptidase